MIPSIWTLLKHAKCCSCMQNHSQSYKNFLIHAKQCLKFAKNHMCIQKHIPKLHACKILPIHKIVSKAYKISLIQASHVLCLQNITHACKISLAYAKWCTELEKQCSRLQKGVNTCRILSCTWKMLLLYIKLCLKLVKVICICKFV
jgi:hypothetical protein